MKTIVQILLMALSSICHAQWSGGSSEVLTSGNAIIEKTEPHLIFDNTSSSYSGLIFKLNGANKMFNFYDSETNEVYWSEQPNFGTANALSLDLDLENMSDNSKGFLQMGFKNGQHLDFDANEIQSRNGTDSTNLYLNYRGGDVSIGRDEFYFDDESKYIGIGTNQPTKKLHIVGKALIKNDDRTDGLPTLDVEGSGRFQHQIEFKTSGVDRGAIKVRPSRLGTDIVLTSQSNLRLKAGGDGVDTSHILILENGNVGMGVYEPQEKLDINGNCIISGELLAYSDKRFKTNISPISNALKTIKYLNPVRYQYNKDLFPDKNFSDHGRFGLIAQEVEISIPELVSKSGVEEYQSVNYVDLIPILIKAIQEQQDQIELLKKQLKHE